MSRSQQIKAEIERLRQENILLLGKDELLRNVISESPKTANHEKLIRNLDKIRELETEKHRITWPQLSRMVEH
jgi:hypothetical protein